MDLQKLFKPNSIAVIGASDRPGMGRGAAEGALRSSISDRVYLINPKRDEVLGRKCYHSLADLPEVVDAIILCVNAHLVNAYLEEAGRKGVKAAVVYASGFREEDSKEGEEREVEMAEIASRYDMLVCGPNCVGIYNKVDRISMYSTDPMFPEQNVERGIGAVAHSGYLNSNLMRSMPELCAYGVSVGNSAVCRLEDYMLYYADNDHVNCIAAYIEGIKDAATFEEALKRAALNRKPVVVMKSGRSRKGGAAAASHTGNLAGDYASFEALLHRYGVVVTDSLEEFYSAARMFTILDGRFPNGTGIAAINFSGGENTICADYCDKYSLELPSYEDNTRDVVKQLIPSFSTARNPLDPTTEMFGQKDKVKVMFETICADPNMHIFVLGLELAEKLEVKDITCLSVLEELRAEGKLLPTFLVPSFEKRRNADALLRMRKIGIPMTATGELAYKMLKSLCRFIEYKAEEHTLDLAVPDRIGTDEKISLSESASKAELVAYGIDAPKQYLITGEDMLLDKLRTMNYPVVLKVDSPDITHKTEAGGVRLGIRSEKEAIEAYRGIMTDCLQFAPGAIINGIQLQEMITDGSEIIVGIKNDPIFGPMLLCGLGGVFAELFKDVAISPCPVNYQEAQNMIMSLKAAAILKGFRGSAPSDIDALCRLMVSLSEYAAKNKNTVAEVDLNPVFVREKGKGVLAADALVVKYIR